VTHLISLNILLQLKVTYWYSNLFSLKRMQTGRDIVTLQY